MVNARRTAVNALRWKHARVGREAIGASCVTFS